MSKSVEQLRKKRQERASSSTGTEQVFETNFQQRVSFNDLIIDDHLRAFIPPLQEEERKLLEQSVRQEGVRDALLYWQDPQRGAILVDGHNRYLILQNLLREGLKPKIRIESLDFEDYEAVKDWMLVNQLGRRNLTKEQRSYLRGVRYDREKSRHGGGRTSSSQKGDLETSERLADEYNVAKNTILRDAELARGIDRIGQKNLTLKRDVLGGNVRIRKADLQAIGRIEANKLPEFKDAKEVSAFVAQAAENQRGQILQRKISFLTKRGI